MKKKNRIYFVTGTDTGVGKTVLSLQLMHYFYQIRKTPFYIKPFQTGCLDPYDTESDAKFIYENIEVLKNNDPALSVINCYKSPKAPYFSSRDENNKIDPIEAINIIKDKQQKYNPLIIEAAGGVMVPITENLLIIDFIKKLNAQVIIAARSGLGTINHTILTIEILKKYKLKKPRIVFINKGNLDQKIIKENIEAIENYSKIKISGVINKIENFSKLSKENFNIKSLL